MKKNIPDWLVQITWFVAGVFATGGFWYFLSVKNTDAAIISGVATICFTLLAVFLHKLNDQSSRLLSYRKEITSFIAQGHLLVEKSYEESLPLEEANTWISNVETYLRSKLDESYCSRFSDFSGMVFYGDASEKSKYKRNIDGRLRRLNQFLAELT